MGFFPVDAETLPLHEIRPAAPLRSFGGTEAYCRAQGLFREKTSPEPEFTDTLENLTWAASVPLPGRASAPGPAWPWPI